MRSDFVPGTESLLVGFTTNFFNVLTLRATQVGLTAADATALGLLNSAWVESYATATEPSTRTKPAIEAKDACKAACVEKIREFAAHIQSYSGTTDELRAEFGLLIPKPRKPVPVPTIIPVVEVAKRWGTTIVYRIHDGSGRARKPAGVQGVRCYTFAGPTPPEDVSGWSAEGQSTRMEVEIEYDSALPPGTKVWFTAAYYNPRGQVGPGCLPYSAILAGGAMSVAA